MEFGVGQQVVYEYDNRLGTITGLRHGDRCRMGGNSSLRDIDADNIPAPGGALTFVCT